MREREREGERERENERREKDREHVFEREKYRMIVPKAGEKRQGEKTER